MVPPISSRSSSGGTPTAIRVGPNTSSTTSPSARARVGPLLSSGSTPRPGPTAPIRTWWERETAMAWKPEPRLWERWRPGSSEMDLSRATPPRGRPQHPEEPRSAATTSIPRCSAVSP